MIRAMQCRSCGGSIANRPGERLPRCLFCGRQELVERELAAVEAPELWVPFAVGEQDARGAFRAWARKRFWAPSSIRSARVELRPLFLPAWQWSGTLETHWTGLLPAATRSGKRPVTGQDRGRIQGVMVPSSPALTAAELAALSPFPDASARRVQDEEPPQPYEVGALSRSVARERGAARMSEEHGRQIGAARGLGGMHASSLVEQAEGHPLLLPIYIGAYLVGERSYRVLINGQTGATTGSAPVSWAKVVGAVLAAVVLAMTLVAIAASSGN